MLCFNCLLSQKGMCAGCAMTRFSCNLCKETHMSGSTHTPKHCCYDCSRTLQICEECGSTDIFDEKWSELMNDYPHKERDIVIVYHADCPDGFAFSVVAWNYFREKDYKALDNIAFIPMKYNEEFPINHLTGKTIYFLDFSIKKELYDTLLINNEIIVIDHHKTTITALLEYDVKGILDINHSGCVLTYNYFYKDEKVPLWLRLIEDYDSYNREYETSEDFTEGLKLLGYNSKNLWYELFIDGSKKDINEISFMGKIINQKKRGIIHDLYQTRYEIELFGVKGNIINSIPDYVNEIGNYACGNTFALIWHSSKDGIKCSLRSRDDFDVSVIAEKFGGGGHKNAAGFTLSFEDFNSIILNQK